MWRNELLRRDDPGLQAAGEATFSQLIDGLHAAQQGGWATGADERPVAYLSWAPVHGLAALWLGGPLASQDNRPFPAVARAVGTLLHTALAGVSGDRSERELHV